LQYPPTQRPVLCQPTNIWSPANDGRALLVPTGDGEPAGYFAFQRGQPFRWVEGPVPGDFTAGLRGTQSRLAAIAAS
jgi:hypothetical protein